MNFIEIPEITNFDNLRQPGKPGWFCPEQNGKVLKPVIRCMCGSVSGIGLHHVHADGRVTNSYYHKRGTNLAIGEDPKGCEWHVWLKLKDYHHGEFPPGKG